MLFLVWLEVSYVDWSEMVFLKLFFEFCVAGKCDWKEVLFADRVFKNSHKAEVPTDAELIECFETSNIDEVAQMIAKKGELQTTSQDRAKALADKKKQIVNYIGKYYIDPKTKKPHTSINIENAWDSAKLKTDPDKPVEEQVKQGISKLREFIPLKRCEIVSVLFFCCWCKEMLGRKASNPSRTSGKCSRYTEEILFCFIRRLGSCIFLQSFHGSG